MAEILYKIRKIKNNSIVYATEKDLKFFNQEKIEWNLIEVFIPEEKLKKAGEPV